MATVAVRREEGDGIEVFWALLEVAGSVVDADLLCFVTAFVERASEGVMLSVWICDGFLA